jgi:hypothetical protein
MTKFKKQNPPMPESFENILNVQLLTPKDPWVFGCKTTQNYPFLKKGLVIIF